MSVAAILKVQRAWALEHRKAFGRKDYLVDVAQNLFMQMSPATKKSILHGDGNELKDKGARPAKMKALRSSTALVVNVFDYWVTRSVEERCSLAQALGIQGDISQIGFEVKCPTGLAGKPPNLDLLIELSRNAAIIGIESKFTEWLTKKRYGGKPSFKLKYFPQLGEGLWAERGLGRSQKLVERIHDGDEQFQYLNATQLLKHLLGLSYLGRPTLIYVYYDYPGEASKKHKQEIRRFAQLIRSDCEFRDLSYQSLFESLCSNVEPEASTYLQYLRSRYFRPSEG